MLVSGVKEQFDRHQLGNLRVIYHRAVTHQSMEPPCLTCYWEIAVLSRLAAKTLFPCSFIVRLASLLSACALRGGTVSQRTRFFADPFLRGPVSLRTRFFADPFLSFKKLQREQSFFMEINNGDFCHRQIINQNSQYPRGRPIMQW